MNRKRFVAFIAVILLAVISAGARERINRNGNQAFRYTDWNEFYKYWNEAAENYRYVYIQTSYNDSPEELLSALLPIMNTFLYFSGTQMLGAIFTNSYLSEGGIGRSFDLSYKSERDAAVNYWNMLLNNL